MIESGTERDAGIHARGLDKTYIGGDGRPLRVLHGADLDVAPAESVAIIGESGSGKSTLLHLLGGLDRPSAGAVVVGGNPLHEMNEDQLSGFRNRTVGFVFQFHHLLKEFTVLENVMMPQLVGGVPKREADDRARELLEQVGLSDRLEHVPAQLSGGEQQRVAVARALANRPIVLLADEPSGNLDPSTSERLHNLLFEVCANEGSSMVLVTHDHGLAARADRVLELEDGQLVTWGGSNAVPELR
jgi:lipoprotein-releasing system ATP-binding protein